MFPQSFVFLFVFLVVFYDSEAQKVDIDRYQVYHQKLTWRDAAKFCKARDSKLAEILTYEQQKDLRTYIRQHHFLPKDTESGYWLGGRLKDRFWRWDATGENPRAINHFMAGWHYGEPDRKFKDDVPQECMELQYRADSEFTQALSWNDIWCDELRNVICESWNHNPAPN
ncbi:unnamed protein product [Ceutorhynchus assimilis]|uniref:C-type lectin domain-containing protein n=1 Tax=Ceutorhynchus assimilis TaxID=467358 RepID=A0A9N9MQS7_9CUCU|nr:unnamed protein product [Ceutorhynchus assimilis]